MRLYSLYGYNHNFSTPQSLTTKSSSFSDLSISKRSSRGLSLTKSYKSSNSASSRDTIRSFSKRQFNQAKTQDRTASTAIQRFTQEKQTNSFEKLPRKQLFQPHPISHYRNDFNEQSPKKQLPKFNYNSHTENIPKYYNFNSLNQYYTHQKDPKASNHYSTQPRHTQRVSFTSIQNSDRQSFQHKSSNQNSKSNFFQDIILKTPKSSIQNNISQKSQIKAYQTCPNFSQLSPEKKPLKSFRNKIIGKLEEIPTVSSKYSNNSPIQAPETKRISKKFKKNPSRKLSFENEQMQVSPSLKKNSVLENSIIFQLSDSPFKKSFTQEISFGAQNTKTNFQFQSSNVLALSTKDSAIFENIIIDSLNPTLTSSLISHTPTQLYFILIRKCSSNTCISRQTKSGMLLTLVKKQLGHIHVSDSNMAKQKVLKIFKASKYFYMVEPFQYTIEELYKMNLLPEQKLLEIVKSMKPLLSQIEQQNRGYEFETRKLKERIVYTHGQFKVIPILRTIVR